MVGLSDSTLAIGQTLVWLGELYLYAGTAVALIFLLWGVDRVDPNARGSYLFRLFAAAGVIGLWPLVLARWLWLEREAE